MALLLKTVLKNQPCGGSLVCFSLAAFNFFFFSLLLSDRKYSVAGFPSCLVQWHTNHSLFVLGVLCSCDKMAQGQLPQQGSACLVRIYIACPANGEAPSQVILVASLFTVLFSLYSDTDSTSVSPLCKQIFSGMQ